VGGLWNAHQQRVRCTSEPLEGDAAIGVVPRSQNRAAVGPTDDFPISAVVGIGPRDDVSTGSDQPAVAIIVTVGDEFGRAGIEVHLVKIGIAVGQKEHAGTASLHRNAAEIAVPTAIDQAIAVLMKNGWLDSLLHRKDGRQLTRRDVQRDDRSEFATFERKVCVQFHCRRDGDEQMVLARPADPPDLCGSQCGCIEQLILDRGDDQLPRLARDADHRVPLTRGR
jgi:hypothetical protein